MKWPLTLSLFVGLVRQIASVWVVVVWYSTTFTPLLSAAAPPVSADATDLHLAAFAAVVCFVDSADGLLENRCGRSCSGRTCCSCEKYVVEVPPRRLSGGRVRGGAGEVVGIDLRHHPSNVRNVAILPLKVDLADYVVLWWRALPDDVLVLAVRGAHLGSDGI